MKKLAVLLALALLLAGCNAKGGELDRVLALRSKLLNAKGCGFDAVITADYGKQLQSFTLSCVANEKGNVSFTVKEPQSICGITGTVSGEGGKLTFDGQALAFELLADEQLSPVSSPWVFIKTLRSGYVNSCGQDGTYLLTSIDDSYADDALQLDIWMTQGNIPVRAEILWNGRRILTMEVKDFHFL